MIRVEELERSLTEIKTLLDYINNDEHDTQSDEIRSSDKTVKDNFTQTEAT